MVSNRSITAKAQKTTDKKYEPQIKPIQNKLDLRGAAAPNAEEKKQLRGDLKAIEEKMVAEVKATVKKEFNYQIPIAEVEKAGISTTGAQIENELVPLANEFKTYRIEKKLWKVKFSKISYEILDDEKIYRIPVSDDASIVSEPEIFYGK